MICRSRILSHYWVKSSALARASLHYHRFTASPFNLDSVTPQIRHFSGKPRFDFGRIRQPDDAVALFREMLRSQPPASIYDFTKLLSCVVRIKQYRVAFFLFDEMLQRDLPTDDYTLCLALNCFCKLKRVDFGFAILGSYFKRGYQPDVVTFTNLLDALFSVGKVCEAEDLFKKLLILKLCKPDEVTYLTVINGM